MTWLAFLLTVIGIFLNARKNIYCWVIWLISNILWISCYLPRHDYPIVMTNAVFIIMNVYGWSQWTKEK